jgi:hypothetical protein
MAVAQQYSLRTLLLLVTAMAVLFALATPYVRALSREDQWGLLLLCVAGAVGAAAYCLLSVSLRRHAEQFSGTTLVVLPAKGMPDFLAWLMIGLNPLLLVVAVGFGLPRLLYRPGAPLELPPLAMLGLYLLVAYWGACGAHLFDFFFRAPTTSWSVELCEHGVINCNRWFVPWSKVRVETWQPHLGRCVLALGGRRMEAQVARDARPKVGDILARQFPTVAHCAQTESAT